MAAKNLSFEASLDRLGEIVARLEAGNEPLEESMKLFEEGSALAGRCYEKLQKAEQKIKELSLKEDEA